MEQETSVEIIGRLLCDIHESRSVVGLDGDDLIIEGHFSEEILERLREAKPLIVMMFNARPDCLPDEWRRLLYRLTTTPQEAPDDDVNAMLDNYIANNKGGQ